MILRKLEAKFDYDYFIVFILWGPKFLQNQFLLILSQIEDMMAIFAILHLLLLIEVLVL